ncbi:MAG: hypothetical protein NTZ49_02205 [Candidatus Parcubacteria bacterium]|nr:hypothetical protein [Candidatus Parcubacteria bacterium]
MTKKINITILLAIAFIALAAASRLVKHPFNFTPIVAMAIFGGYYLKKAWGIIIPLLAMLVSDYFIGFYDWQVMASVYVGIILAFVIGRYFIQKKSMVKIALAALISSVGFFIITNFAVWAFFNWYGHNWAGLVSCFTLALPFFRNSLFGDLIYTGVFFYAYDLVLFIYGNLARKKQDIIVPV